MLHGNLVLFMFANSNELPIILEVIKRAHTTGFAIFRTDLNLSPDMNHEHKV